MARFLLEKCYRVLVSEWHPIIRYGVRHDWRRLVAYPCELSDEVAWGNILAFRDPVDESKLAAVIGKLVRIRKETAKPAVDSLMVAAERCYRLVIDPAFQRLSLKLWRYRHAQIGRASCRERVFQYV